MQDRFDYENENQSQGAYISFSNVQAEDLFLIGVLLDTANCRENKSVHRIFQQKYQIISLFSMEELYTSITSPSPGNSQPVEIKLNGDLLYQLAVSATWSEINISQTYATNPNETTIKKFAYCTNLGASHIQKSLFMIDSLYADQNDTDNIVILSNLLKSSNRREYFDKLSGNTEDLTTLKTKHNKFKTVTVLKMFFSDSPQKAFPYLRAGQPVIKVSTTFRRSSNLVCYTKNLASQSWDSLALPTKVGYQSTEIFLGEHERIIHVNTNTHQIIEQNMIYKSTGNSGQFDTNFQHPVKFMFWALKKQKYMQANSFLAFDSFASATKSRQDFLYDATVRFIQKFAGYTLTASLVTGGATSPLINTRQTELDNLLTNKTYTLNYAVNNYDIIQSVFSQNLESPTAILGMNLTPEVNNSVYNINNIFQRLQCQPLIINGLQKFKKDGSIIPAAGDLLTLEEASIPVTEWLGHLPTNQALTNISLANVVDPLLNTNEIVGMLFSLLTVSSKIVFKSVSYSDNTSAITGDFTSASSYTGEQLFSAIVREDKFNYGLADFDIVVNQWDNYGKYLDKSGDSVVTTELRIGQQPRFKKSGFYTSMYHQYQFFPGVSADGIHVQSFCLDPVSIQSTGSLNFTKAEGKMIISSDTPADQVTDNVYVGAVVYNVIDYQQNTHQVLYSTPIQQ